MELKQVKRVLWTDFRPPQWGGEPRVVLDNVQQWKTIHLWQPEYLKSVTADKIVAVRETKGPPRNVFQNLAEGGQISFHEYLDWVLETGREFRQTVGSYTDAAAITRAITNCGLDCSYYMDVKLGELSSALLDQIRPPAWYPGPPLDINFWCGVLGTSSGLHSDITPNCNVQLVGRKQFTLFPPSQSRLIYHVAGITHCRFDPNIPDFNRFPLARRAIGLECTLNPGEALYIPVGWFHQVTVVSEWAVNVNFFWRRPFPQGLATPYMWRFLIRRGLATFRRSILQRKKLMVPGTKQKVA